MFSLHTDVRARLGNATVVVKDRGKEMRLLEKRTNTATRIISSGAQSDGIIGHSLLKHL